MRAPDAAQWPSSPLRGTPINLAAASLPLVASAGRGATTLPSGDTIPARAFQVAAPMPGGGGFVVEAPANPLPSDFDQIELSRIADAYPPEAAGVPVWERKKFFTPVQLAAWDKRFGDGGR